MTSPTATDEASTRIATVQQRLIDQLKNHPFVAACQKGQVSMDVLKVLLVQQGHYSTHFTRYLCALMSNLSTNEQVLEIASNLFEELGLAPDSPTPHSNLYRQMLQKFDLRLDDHLILPATQNLIDTMFSHCRSSDVASGLGAICLGAEGLVPMLYAAFVKGFSAHGVDDDTLQFFHLHIACDDDHAETLARMMIDLVARQGDSLARIEAAGQALVAARCIFLDEIARARPAHALPAEAVGG